MQLLEENLRSHVYTLAGAIGERNIYNPEAFKKSADYIRSVWKIQGFSPASEKFDADGVICENLIIEIPGSQKPDEIILDRKSTRLNSSHSDRSRMPSSA